MIESAVGLAAAVAARAPLLREMMYALAALAGMFVVVAGIERMCGGDLGRYRSRNFVTDVVYLLVYRGGVYNAFIYAPVFAAVAMIVPSWRVNLLGSLPASVGFFVFWIASDLIAYWIHRWQHRSPLLWRFHSVHHSQTRMTFATSYRNHVVEQLYVNLLMYVPLMVLGMPVWYWAPVFLAQQLLEAVQHADLRWTYGRFYPVVVSPAFHAIHHAPERALHDSNYGKIFGVWDWLFGTLSRASRPPAFGVEGMSMPDSFIGTFLYPFKGLWRDGIRVRAANPDPRGGNPQVKPDWPPH